MDNPPSRGQLNRKISFSLSPFAPGNLPPCHASNTTITNSERDYKYHQSVLTPLQMVYSNQSDAKNGNKKLKKNVRLRVCEHYISVLEETVLYSISVSEERRCSESDAQHSYRYKKRRLNARHILSVLQYLRSIYYVPRTWQQHASSV